MDLYERCPVCNGVGIAPDYKSPNFTTRCHGCLGEKYRPIGFNMQAIQQMIMDSKEAHLHYQADGSAIFIENADELRYIRIRMAKQLTELQELQEKIRVADRPDPV